MDPRLQRRVQRYGWDKASSLYEAYWQSQLEPAQSLLLEMAALEPGQRVLDVACGTGLVTFRIAEAVGPDGMVLGTDISEGMVKLARDACDERALRNATFERMDAEKLNVDEESFDVAICALGLMYLPSPVDGLKEMKRALKPGGRVVSAVWGSRDRCGWAEIFPIVDARVESEVCPMFFHLGTGEALNMTYQLAGLDDVVTRKISTILEYESADAACGAAFAGGPVALAYSRFDERTKAEAHAEYLSSIEEFRTDDGFKIPGEFVVTRGVKR